jgi:diacylglycerol kinase (ATP)
VAAAGAGVSATAVIVNPLAGGARAGRLWRGLQPRAERLAPVDVRLPGSAPAARAAVRDALARGVERVVAVGGDGTVHLVAGELLAAGAGESVTLGIVPAGTGSDLARALALPRRPARALERALLGPPRPIDAGACSGAAASFDFVNVASAGIGGLVDELVNAMPRRGLTAFVRGTVRALRRYRCVPVEVALDGAPWFAGRVLLVAMANGVSFGKGMRAAPGAVVDDGLFDVVLVTEVGGFELLRKLPLVYFGRHLGLEQVRVARARTVHLRPLAPLPVFDADGETYPSGEATFVVRPAALRVAGAPGPGRRPAR